jgi:uncharacterized protein (UPF0332 family)
LALHHDLLEQAEHLAAREPKKPKQASLRRAVSTAYYALFHLLIADGARLLSPTQPTGLSLLIRSAFGHVEMRNVCKHFVQANVAAVHGKRSDGISVGARALLAFPLEPALVKVLEAFVELQEARHQADYDLTKTLNRLAAETYVTAAREAFASWQTIRRTSNTAVFVAALLLQRQWRR